MNILQDTREKMPWDFTPYEFCTAQTVQKLSAGDYVIDGSNIIVIDRKHRVSELATNLVKYRDRFERELERMQEYTYRYILCEFTYRQLLLFPKGAGMSKYMEKKVRAKGKYLAYCTHRLSEQYNVEFIFCDNRQASLEKAMELLIQANNEKQQNTS